MIGGMGQRMGQRPPMGPSPMTAGMPNPMAGFGGGGGFKPQGPPMGRPQQPPPWAQGGMQGMAPWMKPPPPPMPAGGMQGIQVANAQPPPGGGAQGLGPNMQMPGGEALYGGMSDAQMHPFAPRNRGAQGIGPNMIMPAFQQMRPQFPGAMQGGIMGGMGGGPQMGRRPGVPPWPSTGTDPRFV